MDASIKNIFIVFFFLSLLWGVLIDFRQNKIPNYICMLIVLMGLVSGFYGAGWSGIGLGLAGMCVGLFCLIPFYLKGAMGAGDVKLMMGVGAFLGPWNTLLAAALTLMYGGVLGLGVLVARQGIGTWFSRYGTMLKTFSTTGKLLYIPPAENEAANTRFPYALAIALGTLTALWWQDFSLFS